MVGPDEYKVIGQIKAFQPFDIYPDYFARGLYLKTCAKNEQILDSINIGVYDFYENQITDPRNFHIVDKNSER